MVKVFDPAETLPPPYAKVKYFKSCAEMPRCRAPSVLHVQHSVCPRLTPSSLACTAADLEQLKLDTVASFQNVQGFDADVREALTTVSADMHVVFDRLARMSAPGDRAPATPEGPNLRLLP